MSVNNTLGYEGFPCPVGTIMYYSGTSIPMTYLVCDGSSLDREEYSLLFSVLGTSFGTPLDGKSFYLPNLLTNPYIVGGSTTSGTKNAGGFLPSTYTIPNDSVIPSLSGLTVGSWSLTATINNSNNNYYNVNQGTLQLLNTSTGEVRAGVASTEVSSYSGTISGGNIALTQTATPIPITSTYSPASIGLVPIIKGWNSLTPTPNYIQVLPVPVPNYIQDYIQVLPVPVPEPPANIYIGNPTLGGFEYVN